MSTTRCCRTELLSRSVNDLSARRRYVAETVTSSEIRGDAIPHQVLDKIDQVLSLAHTHNLPTVTPTHVLNHLDLAYQYGRILPHTPALDEYGRAFKSYLDSLVEGEEDRTRDELKKCEQCSEKAVDEAVRNCELVKRRKQEEEDTVTLEELEKQRVEALKLVEKERKIVEQERAVYESIADKIKLNTADQDTHLEAAISVLDTMEECIQLVTEDAVNKKRRGLEERQQEWSDVMLQYLLQLRYSIVTCVCIHMMRDEESSESHDKRLGELLEELSVVSDQIHSLNPLIELVTVETVYHRVQNAKQAYCDNYFKNTVNLTESNTNGDLSSMEDSGIVLDTDESDDEYQQNDDEEETSWMDITVRRREAAQTLMEDDRLTEDQNKPEYNNQDEADNEDQDEAEHEKAEYENENVDNCNDELHEEKIMDHDRTTGKKPIYKGKKVYQCSYCPYNTKTPHHLKYHIRTHTGEKPYSCELCGQCFAQSSTRNTHLRRVHSISNVASKRAKSQLKYHESLYQSPSSANKYGDMQHQILKHTGEKPYSCEECGETFAHFTHRNNHMSSAHSETNEDTSEDERMSQVQPQTTKIKPRRKRRKKPYTCDKCRDGFGRYETFLRHMHIVHSVTEEEAKLVRRKNKHKCPHCVYSTKISQNLQRHIRTHTGEKPYVCKDCGKRFAWSSSFAYHIRRIHYVQQK